MNNRCQHINHVPYTTGLTTHRCGPVVFHPEQCKEEAVEGSKYCKYCKPCCEYEDKQRKEMWDKAIENSPSMQKFIKEYKDKICKQKNK